jgi:hypothetical protein
MKTPIQELINKMLDVRRILTDVNELASTPSDTIQAKNEMLTDCIEFAESLLEKEKDVITYAYERGFLAGWMHENCKPLTHYNETFNTEEL